MEHAENRSPRATFAWLAALLTLASCASGCASDERRVVLERLGQATARAMVGSETRAVLPRAPHLTIPAPIAAGCRVVFGYGVSEGAPRRFRATGVAPGGARSVLVDASAEATAGWNDASASVPAEGFESLELRVEGESAGAHWSRPYSLCERPATGPAAINVVLVVIDTLRADRLGAYGNEAALTPSFDAVARDGVVFENAFAQFPSTHSSFGTLFTGSFPSQHGLLPGAHHPLPTDRDNLTEKFAERGYLTAGFTENAWISSAFGFDFAFDRYHNGASANERADFAGAVKETFARGIAWLETQTPGAPFFLFLHTYEVHAPYAPPRKLLAAIQQRRGFTHHGRFTKTLIPLDIIAFNRGRGVLSANDRMQIESLYDAEIAKVDREIARLVAALDALGLGDSTLLVITSDHGEEFDEHGKLGHGESLYTQALHVPMILRLPGTLPAGRRSQASVGLVDLGATLTELAGLTNASWKPPGRSFADLARGAAERATNPVFSELTTRDAGCGHTSGVEDLGNCRYFAVAVRDGRFSYSQSAETGEVHFFDMLADPAEAHDLAPGAPAEMAHYQQLVDAYREAVQPTAAGATGSGRPGVDEATEKRLEALGYLH